MDIVQADRVPRLHIITDMQVQSNWTHLELARQAVAGGADAVQFREKRPWSTRQRVEMAMAINRVCREADSWCVINDRLDVALASQSHAVHLGLDDLPLDLARKVAPDLRMGATAHTLDEVLQAQQTSVQYLGVGPVYGTTSKADARPPLGLSLLEKMVKATALPVIAIGSIRPENIREVMQTGVHGVAVLSYVACASDPRAATEACRDALLRA